jgi:predicted aconitase with swiveling domain
MRVVNYRKWNRTKKIMCAISTITALSFVGGLDNTTGEVHLEGAMIFTTISILLAINIYKTEQRF